MRFSVVGAGGVGGYFAGALTRAGFAVRLLARGDHLAAIRHAGLRVRTPDGEYTVRPDASDDARTLKDADVVLLAVKSYSLPSVLPALRHALDGHAVLVPLLNGVDVVHRLHTGGLPGDRVLGGVTYISASRVAPGLVQRTSPFQRIIVGLAEGGSSTHAHAIAQAFLSAGVDARASNDIQLEIWKKFVFLCPFSVACGLSRTPIGPLREQETGRALLRSLVEEVVAVARGRGVALPEDATAAALTQLDGVPREMRPSFLLDLERGGPTELDALCGAVVRLGQESGVATPTHDTALRTLSHTANIARRSDDLAPTPAILAPVQRRDHG